MALASTSYFILQSRSNRNYHAHHHLETTSIALHFLLGMQSIKLAAGVLVVLVVLDLKHLAPKYTR